MRLLFSFLASSPLLPLDMLTSQKNLDIHLADCNRRAENYFNLLFVSNLVLHAANARRREAFQLILAQRTSKHMVTASWRHRASSVLVPQHSTASQEQMDSIHEIPPSPMHKS
jgi:hypothetical protein